MNLGQLTNQIVLMFCLMLIGVLVNKMGFMHPQTSNDLTNILLYIVSPCLIISAFEQRYSSARMGQLAMVMGGTIIFYIVEIIITHVLFGKVSNLNLRRTVQYGSVYSNAGFMGIPLTSSLFGSTGVFFAVAALAGFNLFSWTHGISLFKSKNKKMDRLENLRTILLNPNILAIAVGLVMFISSFHFPGTIDQVIHYVSSINTPLSMIVIGNSLANIQISRRLLSKPILGAIFLRNILYPILAILIFNLLAINGIAFYTTLLMAACPVAGIVVLFTLQAEGDEGPAVALMSLSTILSLLTIPLIFALSKI